MKCSRSIFTQAVAPSAFAPSAFAPSAFAPSAFASAAFASAASPALLFALLLALPPSFPSGGLQAAQTAPAETLDLYRIPEVGQRDLEAIPKNLARWHMGATLILIENDRFQRIQVPDVGYFEESVFLSDNSALTFPISRGEHDFIVDFGRFMTVSRFFLNNRDAAGSISIKASDTLENVDSQSWISVTDGVSFTPDEIPSATFPEVNTRYLLISLEIEKAGKIGNFGATGPLKITEAEFSVGKGEETDEVIEAQSPVIDFDFGASYTGSRIAFISGGPLDDALNLIDEDPTTTYEFPNGEEAVVILDLKKETKFRTFTAQYTTNISGLVQVYMVDHLPSYFENAAPAVATATDAEGFVERAELASAAGDWRTLLAAKTYETVRVPESYFLEIENSYQARVSPDEDRAVQIFDELERRWVIFRFIPDGLEEDAGIESALYRPGVSDRTARRAQAAPISFGGVQVIGDVEFEDIFFTMEADQGEPGGPPEDPPDDPPVISR